MAETIDVLEAARRLGVTPDAVRAKLRRGTLEGYRDNSGNWRIVSNDTTADTTPEPVRHDTDTTRHDVVSPELARLLKALLQRFETDQARLIAERDVARAEAQEARADAGQAKADQIRMARDMADHHAALHADQARMEAELERARQDADRQRASLAAELERARQDAGLWREEADRERARVANIQADAEHTAREMARLTAELEQARRRWWHRWFKR